MPTKRSTQLGDKPNEKKRTEIFTTNKDYATFEREAKKEGRKAKNFIETQLSRLAEQLRKKK